MSNLYNKYLEMYIEDIDNNNPMVVIGSMEFLPSRVLQEMDPIAFKEGFHNFCDWMNIDLDAI